MRLEYNTLHGASKRDEKGSSWNTAIMGHFSQKNSELRPRLERWSLRVVFPGLPLVLRVIMMNPSFITRNDLL